MSCALTVARLSFIADIKISVFTDKDVYNDGKDYQHDVNDTSDCDHYFY